MVATVEMLKVHLGNTSLDDPAMQPWVDTANEMVRHWRPDLTATDPWDVRADNAAVLQAARLLSRRGSVQGVAAFADMGVTFMPRLDPDVQTILEMGDYQPSVVA